jgi:hypothetical protein
VNAGAYFLIVLLAHVLSFCRQLLGDLENRFNALEEGSKTMVAQVIIIVDSVPSFTYSFDVVYRQSVLQLSTLQNRQQNRGLDNDG